MPRLVEIMRENGELKESDFDELNIRNNIISSGKPKDELCMSRRRFVFLTNPALVKREYDRKQAAITKKAANASRKRKKPESPVLTTAVVVPSTNVPVVPMEVPNEESESYICANPSCRTTWSENDIDLGWESCECCIVPIWTCANCCTYMKTHEAKRCKKKNA